MDQEQRQLFSREMEFYIRETSQEQRRRLTHYLPSVSEYWQCRMGTSAVNPCTAMLEYVCPFVQKFVQYLVKTQKIPRLDLAGLQRLSLSTC